MSTKILRHAMGLALLGAWLNACGGDDDTSPTEGAGPAAPEELTAEPLPGPAVHVTWKDKSADEDNFVLERKVGDGEFSVLTSLPFNETAHHDAEVTAGTTYTYRIAAKNASGVSPYSNEVSATTP